MAEWHNQCLIVEDRRFENNGDTSAWYAIHSPDGKYYLDENDRRWKPNPQMMAGWFMSAASAKAALNLAPCPPGVEPTMQDWIDAGTTSPNIELARQFHDLYERLAPEYGYETRGDTKAFEPNSKNGRLMARVCGEMEQRILATMPDRDSIKQLRRLILNAEREKGSGFDTLASATWDEIVRWAEGVRL